MLAILVALHPSSIPECGCSKALCCSYPEGPRPFLAGFLSLPHAYTNGEVRESVMQWVESPIFLLPWCVANPCISYVGTIYFLYEKRGVLLFLAEG